MFQWLSQVKTSTFKKSFSASVSIEIKDEELPDEKESSKTLESNPVKDDKVKGICKFFLNGKCRFGISGKGYSQHHPKVCRKLQKFGTQGLVVCNEGSNCEFFHHRLCKCSVRKCICLNQDCKLMHIRGTKRESPENSFNQSKE